MVGLAAHLFNLFNGLVDRMSYQNNGCICINITLPTTFLALTKYIKGLLKDSPPLPIGKAVSDVDAKAATVFIRH